MLSLSFLLGLLFAVRNEELIHSQKYDNDSAIKITNVKSWHFQKYDNDSTMKITKMLNHSISKSSALFHFIIQN